MIIFIVLVIFFNRLIMTCKSLQQLTFFLGRHLKILRFKYLAFLLLWESYFFEKQFLKKEIYLVYCVYNTKNQNPQMKNSCWSLKTCKENMRIWHKNEQISLFDRSESELTFEYCTCKMSVFLMWKSSDSPSVILGFQKLFVPCQTDLFSRNFNDVWSLKKIVDLQLIINSFFQFF